MGRHEEIGLSGPVQGAQLVFDSPRMIGTKTIGCWWLNAHQPWPLITLKFPVGRRGQEPGSASVPCVPGDSIRMKQVTSRSGN